MYLTSCHKFNNDQNPLELKTINNTLDLIKTLSHCLINREFGSDTDKTSKAQKSISKDQKSQISNFNEIQHQMEQDYLICIYLFYLFHDLNMMIQEKEMSINKKQVLFKISKIKVNTLLSKELELIIQVAINVCKNIHLSEEGSQISDVTNEKCDRMVENLVYILVNINESPSDLQHFFSQSLVFELEAKGFSVIKYMAGIIKEIDEDVLTKMIDLSFQEELDNYKMFSILFKLLKESEETDIVKSDDESRRSSDSASQTNLLTSISSKKNIIVRALVLAIYKSFSRVYEIQMISRIFFMMFLPYVFCDNKAKDDILIYLEEADEDEDIERILTRAIDIDNMQNRELKRVEERKSNSLPKNKEMKHISTQLIEELNILIGSDLIPLKQMIQFAVKVVILLIPDNLSRDNDRDSDVSLKVSDWHDHYLRQDIAKHENLEKIISRLPGIKLTSILSYLPDFE